MSGKKYNSRKTMLEILGFVLIGNSFVNEKYKLEIDEPLLNLPNDEFMCHIELFAEAMLLLDVLSNPGISTEFLQQTVCVDVNRKSKAIESLRQSKLLISKVEKIFKSQKKQITKKIKRNETNSENKRHCK